MQSIKLYFFPSTALPHICCVHLHHLYYTTYLAPGWQITSFIYHTVGYSYAEVEDNMFPYLPYRPEGLNKIFKWDGFECFQNAERRGAWSGRISFSLISNSLSHILSSIVPQCLKPILFTVYILISKAFEGNEPILRVYCATIFYLFAWMPISWCKTTKTCFLPWR